jgi:hypothetical protein
VSISTLISSSTQSVRLELFPVPLLISAQTNTPTDTPVNATALLWPQPIQFLYSLPILSGLSGWALQGHSAIAYSTIQGQVQWQGKIYPGAQISSQAFLQNTTTAIPVTVSQNGLGNFTLQFIATKSGTYNYNLVFSTSGSYKDSHGDFGPTIREANVTVIPATGPQVLQAYAVTIVYLLCLILLILLIRFSFTPAPYGEWERMQGGEVVGGFRFSRSHRGLWQSLISRNVVHSRQAGMPKGLLFRFQRGSIDVCADERGSADWQTSDGGKIRSEYQHVRSLTFMPGGASDNDAEDISTYTIMTQKNRASSHDAFDDYSPRPSSRKPAKATRSYEDSYDQPPPAKKRAKKRSQRNKSTQWDDDYF